MGDARNGWRIAGVAAIGLALATAACQALSHSDDFATTVDASVVFVVLDSGVQCGSGETICTDDAGATRCTDITSESLNCGGCNIACPTTQACNAGVCGCSAGNQVCGDAGGCVDVTTDPSNCGACGVSCGADHICSASTCVITCPAGTTDCDGSCVDLTTDGLHCGSCTNSCGGGGCESFVDSGVLSYECCGADCSCAASEKKCGGQCIDVQSNASNCGECGVACGNGQTCIGGTCICNQPGKTNCGGTCTTCPTVASSGMAVCSGTQCVCPAGTSLGSSGDVCCPTGTVENGGICCPPGMVDTGGLCCAPDAGLVGEMCCQSVPVTKNGSGATTTTLCCSTGERACEPLLSAGTNPAPATCATPADCVLSHGKVL